MADRTALVEISYNEGEFFDVYVESGYVCINTLSLDDTGYIEMDSEEAIQAARSILKHFNAALEE